MIGKTEEKWIDWSSAFSVPVQSGYLLGGARAHQVPASIAQGNH